MKKHFFTLIALLIMSAGAKAQVTIGSLDDPHSFSILELIGGGERGLRLPQLTTEERDAMVQSEDFQAEKNGEARGLQIFNMTTKCVETWNGSKWIQTCFPVPKEQILFTIKTDTDNDTYYIPTSGRVCGTYDHAYDWNISVDGGAAVRKTRGNTFNHDGIALAIPEAGDHKICITPYIDPDDPAPGWGNAFGHKNDNTTGNANIQTNKDKLISIDAPLTTRAFAPNEGSTNASYMFAYMFYRCTNLTTGAKIVDTYLPEKIIYLSYFLAYMHKDNSSLIKPIDLSGLKDWFSNNQKIADLSNFLDSTHENNTAIETPIDLTPLSGWFSNNTKITTMSHFLHYTHHNNKLKAPINLIPLKNWFQENHSIAHLWHFLNSTLSFNPSLNLTGQKIFPNWIKTLKEAGKSIKDVEYAFWSTFICSSYNQKITGDTGEPEFEDSTVLSSLGNPSTPKQTYGGRKFFTDDITIGSNWK
ncbi:MAG: hypothetical protein LBS54_06970 [Dysgonamonadaceae bacterium]|jgi:hypothetical protein|nr:hypothetical protein [Dysgonamonadaceae bacterium]